MIPFIRSLNELMAITEPSNQFHKQPSTDDYNSFQEDSGQRKRYIRSKGEKAINLPDIPKSTRRKWIKSKKAVSKFLNGLDYNNQIQSSYDLTLLKNQRNYDLNDVA